MENSIRELAKILWDYHHLNHALKKADCIFVLGSHDLNIARYGAELFLKKWAPLMICSGGVAHTGDLLHTDWQKSEGEMFADIAVQEGVLREKILIENQAKNTGENFQFTEILLKEKNINPMTLILVQKPYMERRVFATGLKYWPEKQLIVVSPPVSYEEYIRKDIPEDTIINLMVGDLQRIKLYAKKGFQVYQHIPSDVWEAYEKLVAVGYTKHLVMM